MKVLWWSDFLVTTGFGNVSEAIIERLMDRFDFTVLAVGHAGEPRNVPESPYRKFASLPVYPAAIPGDRLGRSRLFDMLSSDKYDVLFALVDLHNLVPIASQLRALKRERGFAYLLYFPVDASLFSSWVANGVSVADRAFTYTNWGRDEVKRTIPEIDVGVVPHGIDRSVFHEVDAIERDWYRQTYLGISSGAFVVTNVSRHQRRKNVAATLRAWVEVRRVLPQAALYLHMPDRGHEQDLISGMVEALVPPEFRGGVYLARPHMLGCPPSVMRGIYGASDVVMTTTYGEGWCLPITEAMACGVPVVAPRHTSLPEILGDDRGWLVDIEGEVVLGAADLYRVRPVPSVEDTARKILNIHQDPVEAARRAQRALRWVAEVCVWDSIAEYFAEQIEEVAHAKRRQGQREERAGSPASAGDPNPLPAGAGCASRVASCDESSRSSGTATD